MASMQYERQMQDEKREMREAMADALRRDAAELGIDPAKLQDEYVMSRRDLVRGTGKPKKRTKAGVAPTKTGTAAPAAGASGDAARNETEATPAAARARPPEAAGRPPQEGEAQEGRKRQGAARVRRHLTGAEKRDVCRLRDSGWTFDAIGRHLGIAHAGRAGVTRRTYKRMVAAGLWVKAGAVEDGTKKTEGTDGTGGERAAAAPMAPEKLIALAAAMGTIANAVREWGDAFWHAVDLARQEVGR